MIECIVLGDSIAVGTQMQRPECVLVGKGGINSWQFNKNYAQKIEPANTVIISLGSNDHKYVKTDKELLALRATIKASKVFWILPHGNLKAGGVDIETIQAIVNTIAKQYGDVVLPITRVQKDNIHPSAAGYKNIAETAR